MVEMHNACSQLRELVKIRYVGGLCFGSIIDEYLLE